MSEIQKHIESCRAEDPLAQTMEACGNESDIQAALQPLLRETMQGYEPVATTAPTSPIAELPNVLISIIRRVATKPLAILGERPAKQSLLGTLLDTWNAIRQRLSGNPSLGIPDRRADMSGHSLPTALALLSDRKITGVPDAVDGMSLVHLLGGAYSDVTELTDDNDGWSLGSYTKVNAIASLFPNAAKITMNGIISSISGRLLTSAVVNELNLRGVQATYLRVRDEGMFLFNGTQEDVTVRFGWIDQTRTSNDDVWIFGGNMTKVHFLIPKFVTDWHTRLVNNGLVEEFDMSETTEFYNNYGGMVYSAVEASCNALKTFKFGTLTRYSPLSFNSYYNCPNLIRLEVGQGTSCSLDFSSWSPTLDSSNLQQFLLNFREFIAERLAKYTGAASGKPLLTLSQAVRNAIEADGIASFIKNDRNWEISPEPNNQ